MQTMDTSNHVTSHPKKKKVSHQSSSARRWRDSSFDLTKPEKVGKITWHEPGKSQHISHHWRKRNSSSPLSFQLSLGRKYNNCWYFGEVILSSTRDLGVFKWTMSKPRIDLVTFRPEVEVQTHDAMPRNSCVSILWSYPQPTEGTPGPGVSGCILVDSSFSRLAF